MTRLFAAVEIGLWVGRAIAWLACVLVLSVSAHADGPTFSIWHVRGHGYAWQADQQSSGLPLEASVLMLKYDRAANPAKQDFRNFMLVADQLRAFDGQPIALRMDNIQGEIDITLPRVKPTTEENFRQSHNCVRLKADGTLDTSPIMSPWAGSAAWTQAGTLWGSTPFMAVVQEKIPNPTGIILRENNEGLRVTMESCHVFQWALGPDWKKVAPGGVVAAPVGPEWFYRPEETPAGPRLRAYRWRTEAELDTQVDYKRAAEWIAPRRATAPFEPQHEADLKALDRQQYQALYAALHAAMTPAWRSVPFRTVGYGEFRENHQNDTASGPLYIGDNSAKVLTDPVFVNRVSGYLLEAEMAGWQENSVAINRIPVFEGARLGLTAAIDPESYAGYMTHVAWRLQRPGTETRLVGWEGYQTTPEQRLLIDSDAAVLAQIGRPELLNVTIGEYEVALLQRLARIHDHPTLTRFWREGTTQLLDSPLNTASQVKVYATETTIPGSTQTLLTVYTPCDLTGEIPVGEWSVPAKRFGWYLTGGVQEIE